MDSEELYCHEISRRSVARAALHLGIDGMSQDSLDVMADVLQHYMARIGKTVSHLVEASGRTSSHANVLDVLQAIQMTTAPAAQQVNDPNPLSEQRTAPWHDMAVFLFGPKWEGPAESGVGGKLGPSASASNSGGWKAPYLEEVPPFPIASDNVANPHRLKDHVALSLHGDVSEVGERELDEAKLKEIPDKVFTEWGSVGPQPKDAKVDETNRDETKPRSGPDDNGAKEENEGEPPSKRLRLDDEMEQPSRNRPLYIASFMPPFPQSLHSGRSLVDVPISTTANASENVLGVRSSLVDLGQKAQYWGSGWDAAPQVPVGLTRTEQQAPVVVPLGRASNSRVSRILEGSMDAVN